MAFSTQVTSAFAGGSSRSGTHSGVAAASEGYDGVAATATRAVIPTRTGTGHPATVAADRTRASPLAPTAEPASTALRDRRSASTPASAEQRAYGANASATVTETQTA